MKFYGVIIFIGIICVSTAFTIPRFEELSRREKAKQGLGVESVFSAGDCAIEKRKRKEISNDFVESWEKDAEIKEAFFRIEAVGKTRCQLRIIDKDNLLNLDLKLLNATDENKIIERYILV